MILWMSNNDIFFFLASNIILLKLSSVDFLKKQNLKPSYVSLEWKWNEILL